VTRYRSRPAAVVLFCALLAVVAPAAPAQAHTGLQSTTPAANSGVTEPVTAVTLTFGGLIKKQGTTVAVTGPDKVAYSDADPQVLDKTITQNVKPLPVGAITVAWRTVAADGHPMQGSFTFTNNAAPPTPTAEPTPAADARPTATTTTTAALTPAPASSASDDGTSPALWWAVAGGAALALALLGGLLLRRRRPRVET
jgi:methionine-rich copper-binding protein CopC